MHANELSNAAGLTDGVPTMVPETLGYHHQYVCFTSLKSDKKISHAISRSAHEYWQFEEPGESSAGTEEAYTYQVCIRIANSSTIRRCEGQEDPKCSHSIRKHVHLFREAVLNFAS